MTNLEFIEKEIKNIKNVLDEELDENDLFIHSLIGDDYINRLNDELQQLEQIKLKLKAWEIVKEELEIVFRGKNPYGEPLQRYELNVIGQDKINTLEKALEVENE